MSSEEMVVFATLFIFGLVTGVVGLFIFNKIKGRSLQDLADTLIKNAESDVDILRKNQEIELKNSKVEQEQFLEKKWQKERKKLVEYEDRLKKREDNLENRMNLVEKKLTDLERREAVLLSLREQVENDKKTLDKQSSFLIEEIEKLSGLSATEAKNLLMDKLTAEVKGEAANFIRKTVKEAEEQAEEQASRIIGTAINRLAVPCVSQTTVNAVTLPHEDVKGKIIGREGRNIRTLERATGVNFVIDDTPNTVVLSGFDPVRLYVAKTALEELVNDGRIHPTKIEDAVDRAKYHTQKEIKHAGEDAALRAGMMNLHPEIISLIGKLKFRQSYGQNILEHSLEVSHLMGLMAGELGLDVNLAKRIGLLHDMGKAVTHEIEGTHAVIGHDLALKYGETPEVANGIGCHHFEMEAKTIEGSLCNSADAISASRPGARIEAVGEYIKRLKRLEAIAYEFPGIEKAYALQAGRELRIFVLPDMIDDDGVVNLARDLTKRIERDLSYPGKIKVSVTREKQIVEYAM
ncbi:MAG: ribonuclease Y [Chlamydiota bacterium]